LPPWLNSAAGLLLRSKQPRTATAPKLKLDASPTGVEEDRDFDNFAAAKGTAPFDPEGAKTRIDRISRTLARIWTTFLIWAILAQGIKTGLYLSIPIIGWISHIQIGGGKLWLMPPFQLGGSEFIAVVTTTTASVFGFLVIVTNALFKQGEK